MANGIKHATTPGEIEFGVQSVLRNGECVIESSESTMIRTPSAGALGTCRRARDGEGARTDVSAKPAPFGEYLRQAEVELLLGSSTGSFMASCRVTEGCLKELIGPLSNDQRMLGELIGTLARERREVLSRDLSRDLNWLNRVRTAIAHHKPGNLEQADEDDAQRALEMARRLAIAAGLADSGTIGEAHRRAQREVATAPAGLLNLDRDEQTAKLDRLLGRARPVMSYVADGEMEQGHGYLAERAGWHSRRILRGSWKACTVDWPLQGAGLGVRFGHLVEALVQALELDVQLRLDADPLVDVDAWGAPLAQVRDQIGAKGRRMLLRHIVRRPVRDDSDLVSMYFEQVWRPLGEVLGVPYVLLAFETERAICTGFPWLSTAWRASRRDRLSAQRFSRTVEALAQGSVDVELLAELGCVSRLDLAEWLRKDLGRSLQEADAQARELFAISRCGRFELIARSIHSIYRVP